MGRKLTVAEKETLFALIKQKGEFVCLGHRIDKSKIKIGTLLESSYVNDNNLVSFNGKCEFPPHEEHPYSAVPGIYEGTAEMTGLNEFELNNPIIIKKYL